MPLTHLSRTVRFSAAHRYHRPEWSEQKNREVFGACANPYGHGHNYRLEVMVSGEPAMLTGFSVDLAELDHILREEVVERFDHQHLNHAIEEFGPGCQIPTTENILLLLWDRLAARLTGARLVRLRLHEDDDLFVDYYGPGPERAATPRVFV